MHEQHRLRLKNRFLREGLDNFEPHNVLELLLFYSIPRKDVNDTAHDLINRFGSISGVFDASYDELMTVPGIKEHSATLIKMIPDIARYYINDKNFDKKATYNLDTIGEFFINKYIGINVETVYLALLDNKLSLIDCVKVHEGSVNSARFDSGLLVKKAFLKNASAVVLAHNHPNGYAIPSSDDKASTRNIELLFESIGVTFLEHIVVGSGKFCPILSKRADFFSSSDFKNFYNC